MPKTKKMEQAMMWLQSQAADQDDILNSINAQICIEVIEEQKAQLRSLGAHFNNLRKQRDRAITEYETRLREDFKG